MSDEEFEATYMVQEDYDRVRKEINDTIHIMKRKSAASICYQQTSAAAVTLSTGNDDDRYYYRGLETQLPHAKAERKQRIAFTVTAVLQQQQAMNGRPLEQEWVSRYLCPYTLPFAHAAHYMGLFDSQSVFADLRADVMMMQQRQPQHYHHYQQQQKQKVYR